MVEPAKRKRRVFGPLTYTTLIIAAIALPFVYKGGWIIRLFDAYQVYRQLCNETSNKAKYVQELQAKGPSGRSWLIWGVESSDPQVRLAVVSAVFDDKDEPKALARIAMRVLKDPERKVRGHAFNAIQTVAESLAGPGNASFRRELAEAIGHDLMDPNHSDHYFDEAAVRTLLSLGPEGIEVLDQVVESGDPGIKPYAIMMLAMLEPKNMNRRAKLRNVIIDEARARAQGGVGWTSQRAGARYLSDPNYLGYMTSLWKSREASRAFLDDPEPSVRIWGVLQAYDYSQRLGPESLKKLRKMLFDVDPRVAGASAYRLSCSPDFNELEPAALSEAEKHKILEIAGNEAVDWPWRIVVLGRWLLKQPQDPVRAEGFEAIAKKAAGQLSSTDSSTVGSSLNLLAVLGEHARVALPELEKKYRSDKTMRASILKVIQKLDPAKSAALEKEFERENLELSTEGVDFGKTGGN